MRARDGQVVGAQGVSGPLVAAAQRHRQRQVRQALGVGGGLATESLERFHRGTDPTLGLQSAGPAEPRVRGQHGVFLAGDLDDLAEPLGGDGRVAVVQLQLRMAQAQLGVDALTRLDPVEKELGGTPQAFGEEARDHGGRRALARLDEGDVAVGKVRPSQLGLGHAPTQPQSADAVTDGSLTRHLISQGGGWSICSRHDCMKQSNRVTPR